MKLSCNPGIDIPLCILNRVHYLCRPFVSRVIGQHIHRHIVFHYVEDSDERVSWVFELHFMVQDGGERFGESHGQCFDVGKAFVVDDVVVSVWGLSVVGGYVFTVEDYFQLGATFIVQAGSATVEVPVSVHLKLFNGLVETVHLVTRQV